MGMPKGLNYLAHPANNHGDLQENIQSSIAIQSSLRKQGATVINPLTTVDPTLFWDECMEQCKLILKSCDNLILGPSWFKSKGCIQEAKWAIEWDKNIFVYNQDTNDVVAMEPEDIKKIIRENASLFSEDNLAIYDFGDSVVIEYFGEQYTFIKKEKQLISPEKEVSPFDLLETVGRGINFKEAFPEKYHELLSNEDYFMFLGTANQLCIRDTYANEEIYMNKYNAGVLYGILKAKGNRSVSPIKHLFLKSKAAYQTINSSRFEFYCDKNADLCSPTRSPVRSYSSREVIVVDYDNKEEKISIEKDGVKFEFEELETHYLLRLLQENGFEEYLNDVS